MLRNFLLGSLLLCQPLLGGDNSSAQSEEVNLRKRLRESKVEGAKEIAHTLVTEKGIKTLDVSCNELGLKGIQPIAMALMFNDTCVNLFASYNELNDESAPPIGAMLLHNASLEKLDLFGNVFTVKGLKVILDSLKKNHTLRYLSIYCTTLEAEECKSLIDEMLLHNKTIETLLVAPANSPFQQTIDTNLSRRGCRCVSYY